MLPSGVQHRLLAGSRKETRRIDVSHEHRADVNSSTVSILLLAVVTGSYARAIYAGNRVQVNSAHAPFVSHQRRRAARPANEPILHTRAAHLRSALLNLLSEVPMSVFEDHALTISVILILFVIGCILRSLEGKPRA
jgi:hypothetical protein